MSKYVLLVEDRGGITVVGPFDSQFEAQEWEDNHPSVSERTMGCQPLIGRREAANTLGGES